MGRFQETKLHVYELDSGYFLEEISFGEPIRYIEELDNGYFGVGGTDGTINIYKLTYLI